MKTINLLPKPRQRLLKDEAVFRSLLVIIGVSVFSFVLVIAAQFGTKLYLQNQSAAVHQKVLDLQDQIKKDNNSNQKAQVAEINNLIEDYKNLSSSSPKWSRVLKAFAALPPPGIKISNFSINFEDKTIQITGQSPTRELVIQLYNVILNDDKEFYNIDYPFDNVAKPTNVGFHFTFNIRDSLLK